MKQMKKTCVLLALAGALIFPPACGSAGQQVASSPQIQEAALSSKNEKKNYVIAVSLQGMSTPFIVSAKDYLEEACEEAKAKGENVELVIRDGENDAYMQIAQIKSYIKQEVDAIILNPISYTSCTPAVELASEAGIPMVTLMTRVENQDLCVSFSGSDHYEAGYKQAEFAARAIGGKGRVAVVEGVMGMEAQFQRMKAYEDVFRQYPDIEIVEKNAANWMRDKAVQITGDWLEKGERFDAILAQNDDMAMGVIKALKDKRLEGQVFVSGIDGNRDALFAVRDGLLGSTCYMDVRAQARQAFFTALEAAKMNGSAVIENTYMVPFQLVTEENVMEYIDDYNESFQ